MRRSSNAVILMTSLFTLTNAAHMYTQNCSKDEYNRCIALADPLVKDPHFIYPGNLKDIDNICRTWTLFVDCTKRYTEHCFEESKRKVFNKAVENSIELVHQMCTSPQYQTEYLKHASCLRATLFEDSRCGKHYRSLASYVANDTTKPGICCTHHRFRECVLDQTRRTCNQDDDSFTHQLLDKAFGFFRNQCIDYAPNQDECPGYEYYNTMTTNRWQEDKGKGSPSPYPSTKRQDDDWSTSMGGERTSRAQTSGGSFSTPTWRVSDPTKKPDTSYMTNVIDEPNQQGLAKNTGLRETGTKISYLFFITVLASLLISSGIIKFLT
ncbi:uncharacterized protein LOC126838467 [Adelges cooleyi]|uniref:uncharacterized protein LOC126838467 n=1 Tax=Adelges cooleyi TaxID=133065 RepID=UPI00218011AD|nr:uncharacterized protein LOC126838467 [Adelges cooleyi]XP_050428885.1 uncharacterized protein LOC126838467 [Adelges cooleyi]